MCEPRYWKYIRAYTVGDTLRINALRSDDLLIGTVMASSITSPLLVIEVACKINELEEYRSCMCNLENKCKRHKETNKTYGIISSSISTS